MKRNEKAEVMRLLLRCNCIDVEEIIRWADLELEKEDKPPYALIELSLLGDSSPLDIERKLYEIAAGTDPFNAIRIALGQIWKRIKEGRDVDIDAMTQALEFIPPQHNWDMPNDLAFLNGISDYTYLEFVSGSTMEEAKSKLIGEFKHFWCDPVGGDQ